MIGLGTVGAGVVQLLNQQRKLTLKKIAVRSLEKPRRIELRCPISANVSDLIDDPEIEILIEVMGGEHPALEYIEAALERRKHVVTANKEVLAKHGPALFEKARRQGVTIFFEAAVAGGIPLISTMHKGLEAIQISSVIGILNGTTNFILSKMEESSLSYEAALAQAQKLGIAEADPASDVDGHDVAYKLSILSALAFGQFVQPASIPKQGITNIGPDALAHAKELGYRVKLLGICRKVNERDNKSYLDVRVQPMFVPVNHPLAAVSASKNGILVRSDAVDEIILVGPGAGQMPTASAVVGDLINLASALQLPDFASYFHYDIAPQWAQLADKDDFVCPFYLRLSVANLPGVIGRIGTTFGAHDISINTILQHGVHNDHAKVVILTQAVRNGNLHRALQELSQSDYVKGVEECVGIFEPAYENA
jgi:homoserine dehydrogenase